MDFSAQLQPLIEEHGLGRVRERIQAAVSPAVQLSKRVKEPAPPKSGWFGLFMGRQAAVSAAGPAALGESKFGGIPDLPPGIKWPHAADKPLGFIAQIDCATLRRFLPANPWQAGGTLFFFYDFIETPWADEEAVPHHATLYVGDRSRLAPAVLPDSVSRDQILLPEFPVDFATIPTLPGYDTPEMEALGLTEREGQAYSEFRAAVDLKLGGIGPQHQLGGFPANVQGDVRAEFEVYSVTRGRNPNQNDWESAGQRATRWELLLQVDTDADLNVMWGDAGMIYWGLRREDLMAARFDRSRLILQCG